MCRDRVGHVPTAPAPGTSHSVPVLTTPLTRRCAGWPKATSHGTGQDQSSDPSSAQRSVLDFPHHLISLKASVEEVTMIQERLMGHSRGYGGGRS